MGHFFDWRGATWYMFRTVTRHLMALGLLGALLFWPTPAPAQSEKLLEATRLQRPGALELAQSELQACIKRSCPDAGRLSLLIGELLLSRGEPAQALAVLKRFPAPAPLGPYRDYALGEAAFYLRDYRGAAAHFLDAAGAPGAIAGRAEARAGEAFLLAREPGEALPLLEKGLAQLGGPELISARAEARAQLGDLAAAQADLHTLLVRYPRSQAALEVDAQLRGSSAPAVALTLDERLGRARSFLDAGDARQALAEVERIDSNGLARDAAGKAQLALFRAQALYPLGRAEEGDAALEVAAQGPPVTASEALLVRARRLLRLNDNAGALLKFQEVSRKYPGEIASEEADYFIGWIALQEGRIAVAAQALEAFEKKHPESHRRDDACWFRALALIRQGNWAEADRALRELVERYPKSTLVPQARYWRARVKQLSGGNSVDDYLDVVRTYPASFYALVASELKYQAGFAKTKLPRGAIHGDLFCDNVLFVDGRVSGIIDFGFAATDALAYDLAITVNDWCVPRDAQPVAALDDESVRALIGSYAAVRPLAFEERALWGPLLRAAALRFWLSRLYDLHLPRHGELTHAHDPSAFEQVLRHRVAHEPRFPDL